MKGEKFNFSEFFKNNFPIFIFALLLALVVFTVTK